MQENESDYNPYENLTGDELLEQQMNYADMHQEEYDHECEYPSS